MPGLLCHSEKPYLQSFTYRTLERDLQNWGLFKKNQILASVAYVITEGGGCHKICMVRSKNMTEKYFYPYNGLKVSTICRCNSVGYENYSCDFQRIASVGYMVSCIN